jgi:hypothetical protein
LPWGNKKGGGLLRRPWLSDIREGSGDRRVFLAIVFGTRLAGAAAGLGRLLVSLYLTRADRRRKDAERNPLLSLVLVTIGALVTSRSVSPSFTVDTIRPLFPVEAFATTLRVAAWLLADLGLAFFVTRIIGITLGGQRFLAIGIIVFIVATRAALRLLVVEPRAAVLQHPEIVVGVLKIIFGLDAVAGKLRIARETLVLLQQLGGIAALAVILTIAAAISSHTLRTLSAAATTTAALTIIDQILVPCRTGAGFNRSPFVLPFNGSVVSVAADRPALKRKSTLPLPSNASAKARRFRRRLVAGAHHFLRERPRP